MFILIDRKKTLGAVIAIVLISITFAGYMTFSGRAQPVNVSEDEGISEDKKEIINWVDFNVTYEALDYAIKIDIEYHDSEAPVTFIELLAYIAAKNGNNFKGFKTHQIDAIIDKIKAGETMESLTKGMKYYNYYHEAYTAALSGIVGDFEIEVDDELSETGKRWDRKYGIKAFSPFAKGFYYNDYDDFGAGRSYGYSRKHLGHDMIGSVGTPIIAIESGYVEELGWNQYGGWRIGIRSFDRKRYYYYAHLRKDFPYNKSLQVGSEVTAGDVIGYLGRTGYSVKENVNNINVAHLHVGLQLIFDESQKDCYSEIWIDVYPITQLLYRNRSAVVKNEQTKEYGRIYGFREITED